MQLTSENRSAGVFRPAEKALLEGLSDIRRLGPGDADFPSVIAGLAPMLWVRGKVSALTIKPRVTIVGSRAASARGRKRAHALGLGLGQAGALVISGGALGIDAAAHEGALQGGGRTCAVLGTGIEGVYPARHAPLFSRIRERGCLLSMFDPGAPPRRQHFPQRNVLMAALADVVIVVEASFHSGTESTAQAAYRANRPVFCFPDSPGTEKLLHSGARAVTSVEDALAQVGLSASASPTVGRPSFDSSDIAAGPSDDHDPPSPIAAQLACALKNSPLDLGELCARTGFAAAECAAALIELELCGQCSRLPGGRYIGHSPLS